MDKLSLYDKVLFPVVTEKSTNMSDQNKVVFKVRKNANKKNLKKNIEKIFKVNQFNSSSRLFCFSPSYVLMKSVVIYLVGFLDSFVAEILLELF